MVQSKASKGTVSVESFRGKLRLHLPRFLYGGKNKYLSLGLDDTPENRRVAEAKANDIEKDILYERFDSSLNKYRPDYLKPIEPSDFSQETPKLDELWAKFIEYKRPQCSPSTMYKQYRNFTAYVNKLPFKSLEDACKARDWILDNLPLESAKRLIVRINACCNWAIESGMITTNPFNGMAKGIKKPKGETDEGFSDINPFSAKERDVILAAFKTNAVCSKYSSVKHSHYYPYVWFLFNTGCRPSEAAALRWKDIEDDFSKIYFSRGAVASEEGIVEKSGLKTQKRRTFPCNSKMREFLASIKLENSSGNDLLFPAPGGGLIDGNNFRGRTWEPVLEALKIEYRKPYQTRHTFITLALENGVLVHDVARAVGNSPEVIYKHYVGNRKDIAIPEF